MPTFAVILEEDGDGWLFATVPELPGCHTQARSRDELMQRIRTAITDYRRAVPDPPQVKFLGVVDVEVP